MEEYKIVNISEETKNIYKECFDKNGSKKNIENIEWQFLNNPQELKFVDIAIDKKLDTTAAIYAIFPVEFKIGNSIFVGSQSLDTMTDESYRGKGLFINLAKSVYQKAANSDIKLVYGFPNGNSIHGFKKKLNWEVLDPLPFLIKPLKTAYFTRKISIFNSLPNINLLKSKKVEVRGLKFISSNEFPVDVNKIWEIFSEKIGVSVNRNKKYLDWRYIDKPFENYKITHAYTEEGKYLGFVVYTVKDKHEGKIGYIMELIYDTNFEKAGRGLLKTAISEMNKMNADCILSWCLKSSPNYSPFKSQKFIKMPERFRPIELHFGVRVFDEKLGAFIKERKNWYLSYSDSDTV